MSSQPSAKLHYVPDHEYNYAACGCYLSPTLRVAEDPREVDCTRCRANAGLDGRALELHRAGQDQQRVRRGEVARFGMTRKVSGTLRPV